jgi:hypothetical protein
VISVFSLVANYCLCRHRDVSEMLLSYSLSRATTWDLLSLLPTARIAQSMRKHCQFEDCDIVIKDEL